MYWYFYIIILGVFAPFNGLAQSTDSSSDFSFTGHVKYQFNGAAYPENSIFNDYYGNSSSDHFLETRLNFSTYASRWRFNADYQLIAARADTLRTSRQLISDRRRWWNLTSVIHEQNDTALLHRLDRLNISYTSENAVVRFGRQAISWGNGLLFTPMDIFNPFDPAAVDKEYKSGDDMLYGQYLFSNGSDLQGTAVVRRDPVSGKTEESQSSMALKYHGFLGMNEYDLLYAEHYDDRIVGIGGSFSPAGTVLRGDVTWTQTSTDNVLSAVVSASYSWTWGGKNISGVLEYFYNGFGQRDALYAPSDLLRNPDLARRLERGELFTVSRNYLAASATVELNPLLMLIPNLFLNLEDPSALAQLVVRYDWKQELQLLAALNVPVGASGSEYGGIPALTLPGTQQRYFSNDYSLFGQLAWYF